MYGATVQLPVFDKLEPRAWFRIADANFGIRRVTDSVTKYYYVLSKLDSETLRKLSAFLDLPLGADPYLDLRQKLCTTFEPPLEAKLDAFLATNDAGDERPAQFGLELQRLLANATTDDLCKRVFLRSIKPSIVTAITGSLAGNFETVMAAADKAWMAAANDPQGHFGDGLGDLAPDCFGPPRQWTRRTRRPWRSPTRPPPPSSSREHHALPLPSPVRRRRQKMCFGVFAMARTPPSRGCCSSLSHRGSARRRGRASRHELGKRVGRSPSAAGPPHITPRPAQLGLLLDRISRKRCLLDTGSQVSLWPASTTSSPSSPSSIRLAAVNGTPIKSFGRVKKQIKLGDRSYSFTFILAHVKRPILGLDFLQAFKMSIDLCKRRLAHSGTFTRFASTSSSVSGVNVVHAAPFTRLLSAFPEITDPALASSTSRHGVECFIDTSGPPIKTSPRRLTPDKLATAKRYFDLMCAAGICRRSNSPWSSGLHMVPKKDGSVRPCGDYRRLNERTSGDAYPIPHVQDFAAGLAGCRIFSKIDLVKGYHQVPVHPTDVPKTAIATPFGLFEFLRMPFGLKNAAQTFQRLMDNVTDQLTGVFAYIDDVLVASPSVAQHERDLRQLFEALRRFGLVLNTDKCVFGAREIDFLGHRVSARGIRPLPDKVEAVRRFERPRSVRALQRFLGLVNFYRRFLPNIAATMRPLTDALAGAPRQLQWTDGMSAAFEATKQRLATAALLVHPVPNADLRINTDASTKAIAGAIHQVIDGQPQPLGFFSRRTTPAESRYSAYDLELLAIYSTIIKYRHVLEGRRFRIYTDQKPLTSAFFKARDPVSNRQRHQLAFISEFATDVAHVPGLENVVADAFTRQYDDEKESALVNAVTHTLSDVNLADLAGDQRPIDEEPPSSLRLEQVRFPGVDPPVVCDTSLGRPRVLVPETRRHSIFDAIHNLAHPSGRTTLAIIAKTYAWRGMRRDVLRWARQCQACATSKIAKHTKAPVLPIPVPRARFTHVHIDIVGPFSPDRGFKYLLTMIDRTTRWPEAVPLTDTKTDTVLQAFVDHWISRFGVPAVVTSDRGAQFTSGAWRQSLSRLGISASSTTAYHPQANGLVERLHRTLKNALRCAGRSNGSWSRALPWVLLGLRSAPRPDTAASAAEIVFGTPLRIPGLCFQDEQSPPRSAAAQLDQVRSNVASFTPRILDLRKFKDSPFVAKALRTASFVYVRDDRLGKPSLAPRYSGPFLVKEKCWDSNTFLVDMGKRTDSVSISRLKAASVPLDTT